MKQQGHVMVAACGAMVLAIATLAAAADQPSSVVTSEHTEVTAVVDKIDSGMIFMKIPGQLQPRTLALTKAERLGLGDLKPGDALSLVIDENNIVIDAHRAGTPGRGHQLLEGRLEDADSSGKKISLSTTDGTKSFNVDPGAVSKITALKKGARLKLEVDEANTVIDLHPEK